MAVALIIVGMLLLGVAVVVGLAVKLEPNPDKGLRPPADKDITSLLRVLRRGRRRDQKKRHQARHRKAR